MGHCSKVIDMLKSIRGIYRGGKVELLEPPPQDETANVVITFLPTDGPIELAQRGIDPNQAADLRLRLQCFAEDWNRPEMDIYDEP
jgi:hypothetical protein